MFQFYFDTNIGIVQFQKVLQYDVIADLNLLSWSAVSNLVALALGPSVYLWNASSGATTELCELTTTDDYVSSVSWLSHANILAVGNSTGAVQVMTHFCSTPTNQTSLKWYFSCLSTATQLNHNVVECLVSCLCSQQQYGRCTGELIKSVVAPGCSQ